MDKWLKHPELYYPEPVTLTNCMKWHLALDKLITDMHRKVNAHLYEEEENGIPKLHPISEYRTTPEIEALRERDRQFFFSLGYLNVALIEAAILLGREFVYLKKCGDTQCIDQELLSSVSIRDLEKWAEIFDIPLTEQDGGNINMAYEYAFWKRSDFMQAYIDNLSAIPKMACS